MALWDDGVLVWDDTLGTWDEGQPTSHAVRVDLDGFDVTNLVRSNPGLTIRHGRDNPETQPAPNSVTFTVGPLPAPPPINGPGTGYAWVPAVGMHVRVRNIFPGSNGWQDAFNGVCTDLTATLVRLPDGSDITAFQVIAVSDGLGRMARVKGGDAPWPAELDGARISRVIALAGVTPGTIDAGQFTVNARDVDAQYTLELGARTAGECLGILIDGRDGSVSYQDASYRDPAGATAIVIPASETLTAPTMGQHVGAVINKVRLTYGPTPETGERPVIIVEDAESIAARGLYEVSVSTEIVSAVDADIVASRILELYSVPRWGTERLQLTMEKMTPDRLNVLGNLAISDFLSLTDWPLPAAPAWAVWIEGIEDTYSFESWRRDLLVSDRWSSSQGNPDPAPDIDCGVFDWDLTCATDNIIPYGLPVEIVLDSPDTEGVWSLDPDAITYVLTFDPVASATTFWNILLTPSMGMGAIGQAHLDPFNPATDLDDDHCMGYDMEPFGDPGVIEFRDSAGTWHPGVKDVNWMLFASWLPDAGYGANAQTWGDGIVFSTGSWADAPASMCAGVTNQAVFDAWADPSLIRVATPEPGRWGIALYTTMIPPTGPTWPAFGVIPVRWSGQWGLRVRVRYARAQLAG